MGYSVFVLTMNELAYLCLCGPDASPRFDCEAGLGSGGAFAAGNEEAVGGSGVATGAEVSPELTGAGPCVETGPLVIALSGFNK